jgi:uncharacterized YccA/Bax inhibitor family protein
MEIVPPQKASAFAVTHKEWDLLKSAVSTIDDSNSFFHTIGSALVGAGLSTVITVLLTSFPQGQETQRVIMWAAAVLCLLCGGLSLYFAHKEAGLLKTRASQVLSQMKVIEERWPRGT